MTEIRMETLEKLVEYLVLVDYPIARRTLRADYIWTEQ